MSDIRMGFKLGLLFVTALLVIAYLVHSPAIPQDIAYHQFADQRAIWGIPNFWNVISNLPFFVVGFMGLRLLWQRQDESARFSHSAERYFYLIFFVSIFLVGFGSSYYHLQPNNQRLIWDRLPMTIAFMSFFSAMIAERLHLKTGLVLFVPLLVLGLSSVWYWHYTEMLGAGDLRFYYFIQFFPIIAIPLLLLLFSARYSHGRYLWWLLFWYMVAKFLETYDRAVFDFLHQAMGGHALKHFAAAWGTYMVYRYVRWREKS